MDDDTCPACGGSGWIELRTRGMCGIDCDFGEIERVPCPMCQDDAQLESA